MALSLRAYARHRAERNLSGGTLKAVQRAIESGRIERRPDGTIDPEAADRDWAERTSHDHRRGTGLRPMPVEVTEGVEALGAPSGETEAVEPPRAPPAAPEPVEAPSAPRAPPASDDGADGRAVPSAGGISLAQAAAVEKAYKARLARLDYEERLGKLVAVDVVTATWQRVVVTSRNRILAIPSKIRSRLPHLAGEDVVAIEALLREALEELADGASIAD